ncbi:MAG: enoyl-CoA hydratase/isomerase family protein [Myxococcota bacterium]
MSWNTLEIERQDSILHVWLARPEKRNALNGTALEEIAELFAGLQRDYQTRVVIFGGRGSSFCGGADRSDPPGSARLRASSDATDRERRHVAQLGLRACRAIEDVEAITLARVHGHAIGGGLALALACDFRIAAAGSTLQLPEVDLGIPLTWGATPRLIQEVGAARARELILMCEPVDAATAANWGLIHRCVPADRLDSTIDDWARRLVAKPEVAVHMTKTQFRAYARSCVLGDVTETDGDLLLGASRIGAARESFRS